MVCLEPKRQGEPLMADDTNPRARAIAALAELFFEAARRCPDFSRFESESIDMGHECMAQAIGLALEALDAELLSRKPSSLKAHDMRRRVLATEVGDVAFSVRRYRDRFGNDVCLLADELDVPYGCRVSPGATEFLVEAAAHVSYRKAAALLARHGSSVGPTSVMRCMRQAGLLCAEEDAAAAESLYGDGVVPEARLAEEELCVEADGTWFRLQGVPEGAPRRAEVKAVVAYAGKELKGRKVRRRSPVRHACIAEPERLWTEAVAVVGGRFDLSRLERVHLGGDGEPWCSDLQRYLPRAEVAFHLDPFHVNRAVLSCFPDPKMGWNVLECVNDGDKESAVSLLKACLDLGVAREKRTRAVIGYLEGNLDAIAVDGPSLGTMESENQHLYGVRMDAFPCAWSVAGASDMARIISRRESGRAVPRMTRERSAGGKRGERRLRKELRFYERQGGAGRIRETEGSGYLPPHQADTRRMAAGKAYALHKGMAKLGRGL